MQSQICFYQHGILHQNGQSMCLFRTCCFYFNHVNIWELRHLTVYICVKFSWCSCLYGVVLEKWCCPHQILYFSFICWFPFQYTNICASSVFLYFSSAFLPAEKSCFALMQSRELLRMETLFLNFFRFFFFFFFPLVTFQYVNHIQLSLHKEYHEDKRVVKFIETPPDKKMPEHHKSLCCDNSKSVRGLFVCLQMKLPLEFSWLLKMVTMQSFLS